MNFDDCVYDITVNDYVKRVEQKDNGMVNEDLNGALMHVKKALIALDDTHLISDARLDDLFAQLSEVEVDLTSIAAEYKDADTKYWDTTIGDY